MKLHFIGAVNGDKNDYKTIVDTAKKLGWALVTEHSLKRNLNEVESESDEESQLYAKRMTAWLRETDAVLVESTKNNLGAGFEIATALNLGKPVIVMYRLDKGSAPYVLKGISSDKLQVISYNDRTLHDAVKLALDYASESQDTRFNFFISPNHQNYLNWIAKNRKIPRSVFLRRLIDEHMKNNEEYNS